MATTLGDRAPSGEASPVKRPPTLAETLAERERLARELEAERADRLRLEDELREARRLESLGRLAGSVAHDFSNILAVVSGYSELMLKRMDPTDPLRSGAESIRKAAMWGLNLTQHLVTSSRATAPSRIPVDPNAIVASVTRTLQPLLGEGVEVVHRLCPDVSRVNVNPGGLEQALVNLLLNARDAMPGGGRVTLETADVDVAPGASGPPAAVMIRVTDTGGGMDAATLSRAFEPYFTTKPPGKGTGLGLATVFAFVTQSEGHVEASSEVGHGTTFSLYLPRHAPAPAEPIGDVSGAVLVVEPETGVRDLIGEILELNGYTVLTARDADEAVAVAAPHAGRLALLVVDLMLSGVADDVLVRRLGPAGTGLKVLYLSGDLQDTVEEYRGLRPGRAFLHKPFTIDALTEKVRLVLAG
jgi:hypothetical protein